MANDENDNVTPIPAGKAEVVRMSPGGAVPDEAVARGYLRAAAEDVDDDPEKIADSIVSRILRAESVDDVLAPQAIEHARDLIGVPMEIRSARFQRSDYEEGPEVYMVCEAEVLDDGRVTTFSCGGRSVMAQVYRIAQLGGLPFQGVLVQSPKPTRRGFRPLWLESLGPRDKMSGAIDRAKESSSA
jgi:hypothetical protein